MPAFTKIQPPNDKRVSRFAVVMLGALLSHVSACQKSGATATQPSGLSRDPLRLVTWNIQKCERGIDAVVAELVRVDADILCLQEVIEPRHGSDAPNQTHDLARALGMFAYSSGGPLDERRQQCLAILCRAPLDETATLTVDPQRNYGVTAVTQWKGQPLRIVCVHLAGTYKVDVRHIIETSQDRAQDWMALQKESENWKERVILAGDFNTPGVSPEFTEMNERLRVVPDTGRTFPSQAPLLDLDHVLCSSDLSASLVENVESETSDHRALRVAITLGTD